MRPLSNSIKSHRVVFWLVVVCLFCSAAFGQPWVGGGVEGDPYLIYTALEMWALGGSSPYWDSHFKLMADVDLSGFLGTSIGTDWRNTFSGVFDGNGHTISNFNNSSAGTDYVGVFGYVDGSGPEIKNLGLIDPNVTGQTYVGSLVGRLLSGTVSGCFVEGGSVSGWNVVGGLVGQNRIDRSYRKAIVTNCYSSTSVTGNSSVGGLVGDNGDSGTIVNCYATGMVSGSSSVGGLVGSKSRSSWSGSYWDTQTSGQSTSAGGVGKTTAQMKQASTYIGWGCGAGWTIDEGVDYPHFIWEGQPGEIISEQMSDLVAGAGTENDPYLIYTAEELNLIGLFPCALDEHFKLMANIDVSAYTGTSFNMIGTGGIPFSGVFDGNGHTISNFTHSSTGLYCIALFRWVEGSGAEIKNLGLIDANVTGQKYVGSLVGQLIEGTVTGCYSQSCDISGTNAVGGLVAANRGDGIIINCYSSGVVSGGNAVGGLVGGNGGGGFVGGSGGTISDSNSSASVVATGNYVGGLVGETGGSTIITDCYTTGSVSGGQSVGGLVGMAWGGETISNCYSTASVTGNEHVGGFAGYNRGTITNCYSKDGSVSGNTGVGGLVGKIHWQNNGSVINCFSMSPVSGGSSVGGLAGVHEGTMYNCYAGGSVLGTGSSIGGLVGNNSGTIFYCYSAGSVSGSSLVGGLIGSGALFIGSFWDVESSGQIISAGGTGLPTAQMQMESTFTSAGWDFVFVWDICEGTNYPKLAWQVPVLGDFGCPDGVDWSDLAVLCGEWLFEELSADVWPDGGDGFVNFLDWAIFADGWQTTHDIFDLAEFADQWLKTGSNYLIADIAPSAEGDGIVNFLDFATLANNWLERF